VRVVNLEKQRSGLSSVSFAGDIAIVSLVLLLAALAPIGGVIALLFIPLPVFFYYAKNGRARGIVLTGLSLTTLFFAAGIIDLYASFPLLALLTFSGVVMAEVLHRNYPIEKTVAISVAATCVMGSIIFLYQSFRFGETPWHMIGAFTEQKIREGIEFYTYLNISPEQIKLLKENIAGIVFFITAMFPAICLVSLTFMVWINLLLGKRIFRKYGLSYPDFGDLSLWKAPEKMVWYLIAAGAILLLPDERTEILGWNVLIVILFAYLLAGIAIISFYLKKNSLPSGLRYLIYFLVFAQQIVTLLVVTAGLFDLWVDFRKLNKPMENPIA
jgi:uncharacterized protein YybS (DUF2232 family)